MHDWMIILPITVSGLIGMGLDMLVPDRYRVHPVLFWGLGAGGMWLSLSYR